jgi:alpha-L-rhamnosidase
VKAALKTVRGTIVSEWEQQDGKALLKVTIPANCVADVHLPAGEGTDITESGASVADADGVVQLSGGAGASIFAVGSGTYRFEFCIRDVKITPEEEM